MCMHFTPGTSLTRTVSEKMWVSEAKPVPLVAWRAALMCVVREHWGAGVPNASNRGCVWRGGGRGGSVVKLSKKKFLQKLGLLSFET